MDERETAFISSPVFFNLVLFAFTQVFSGKIKASAGTMKRRNVDNAKFRRTLKKNKISDNVCGSSLVYLKLLLVWALVMTADFLLDLRFEYIWPFWLLLRSIYDSFRYQGVAFSVFFVCITVTSDMICFLFIPVQWLFFIASTYVWVQYVWHADRGICLPTVSLWLLFIYVEASIRLKELKSIPFTLDLCRPFAAHCIGYPVVTLGFGIKSYVSYRMRLRKQREVARVNSVYTRLLAESLPVEQRIDGDIEKYRYLTSQTLVEDTISNGAGCNGQQHLNNHPAYFANHNNAAASSSIVRHSTKNSSAASVLPKKSSVHSVFPAGSTYSATSQASSHTNVILSTNGTHFASSYASNGNDTREAEMEDDEEDTTDGVDIGSWLLNAIKSKLGLCSSARGVGAATSPSTATLDTSSSSWVNNSWSSPSMLHDSDDESRESKDSRDGMFVGSSGNGTLGSDSQLVRRFHSSSSSLSGITNRQRTKRRGGGTSTFYALTPTNSSPTLPLLAPQQQSLDNGIAKETSTTQSLSEPKEKVQDKDLHFGLELDIEKLKTELRTTRTREQDLRQQIQQFTVSDKSIKSELQQLRQNNEQLQTRVQNLVRARQQDKQNMVTMEKKLADEQKVKAQVEQQLQQERKQKKADEASRNAAAAAVAVATVNKTECTESCKQRKRELETQVKQLRRDLQLREEQLAQLEGELRALRHFKEQNNTDILMSALSAMQEKNMHLESSLSAETRVKLDLFSALGEAKRQLEIAQSNLSKREQEIGEMRRCFGDHPNELYLNAAATPVSQPQIPCVIAGSALTPPPVTLETTMDLVRPTIYQASPYMQTMPGIVFDEHTMNGDFNAMSLLANIAAHNSTSPPDVMARYSPPRSTSH